MTKHRTAIALLMVVVLCLTGCSLLTSPARPQANPSIRLATSTQTAAATPAPTVSETPAPTATPEPLAAKVLSIDAALDPSVAAADVADPYAQMDRYAQEVFHPDRDLYNLLYRAIDAMQLSVDVSSFKLTHAQMLDMYNCLYSEAQYRFYYLKNVKLSKDGKTALISYTTNDVNQIKRNKETFEARLSHLLYNVAPEGYTDLQKALSVYQYICENANYTTDLQDPSTWSPYSILLNGRGICNGFANLTDYVLNRVGVPSEYVANENHAWDIVTIGGKQYHMDVTFGAGSDNALENALNTVLMDDATRLESLKSSGADVGKIILGYPQEHPALPPACTDTSMAAYNHIYNYYALDIDHGKVYYANNDGPGILRMNLDCTGVETVSTTMSPSVMRLYNGVLYFLGGESSQLYRLSPDGTPVLLDDEKYLTYMDIVDGTLRYSPNYNGSDYKSIRLSAFDPHAWDGSDTVTLPALSVPRSRSFAIHISFSEPMDRTAAWQGIVTLADKDGNPLPAHLLWSQDGKTLTVRPKECVADLGSVAVYISSDAPTASGGLLEKEYTARVDVRAEE